MRLFVSGISGYLGGVVLRTLEGEPCVEEIVGVDVRPPATTSGKLDFRAVDVRDPAGVKEAMRGCDAALHLAFILDEIRDKKATYDINVNGSKNVFHASLDAGVPWLIQLSSMAAFGAYPDNPFPIDEDEYPRGDPRCYYSYCKAEIEHYLCRLSQLRPELAITILRPCVIVGEGMDNTVSWVFSRKLAMRPRDSDPHTQFIHEDDLAEAIRLVLLSGAKGIYHITSDDTIALSEMIRRAGMYAPRASADVMCRLADLAFFLRLSPMSSHWINMFRHSMVGSSEKIKRELGWRPKYTSRELFELVLQAAGRTKEVRR